MKAVPCFGKRKLVKTVIGLLGLVGSIVLSTESWTAQIPFSKAKIIFEFNSSGPDLGIQVSLDGEPWNEVTIVDPTGRAIFEAEVSGRLTNFGLTELFAESNEPNFEDVAPEDILERFPAGTYKFFGKAVEGERLVGTARLTHAIPDGPSAVLAQAINGAVVISWVAPPPVSSLTGRSVTIVAYQVIVEREDNDALGAAPRVFDIKLPATETSVLVPPQFLEAGPVYRFEVLAIDRGGNQSITEGEPFQMQ
jgi:hypothetical protein